VRETCLSAPHAALDWDAWQAVEATENDDSILSLLGLTTRANYTFVVPPSESQTTSFIQSAFSGASQPSPATVNGWQQPHASAFNETATGGGEMKTSPSPALLDPFVSSPQDEKRSHGLSSTPLVGLTERKVAPQPAPAAAAPITPTSGGKISMTYSPTLVPLDLALIANTPHLAKIAVQQVLDVHGRIDILINNAGVSQRGSAVDTQHVVDRYVTAAFSMLMYNVVCINIVI
jgi:hypothetical protein